MDLLNWSQRDMASVLGVDRRFISYAVSGRCRAPPEVEGLWTALERFALALPVPQRDWPEGPNPKVRATAGGGE